MVEVLMFDVFVNDMFRTTALVSERSSTTRKADMLDVDAMINVSVCRLSEAFDIVTKASLRVTGVWLKLINVTESLDPARNCRTRTLQLTRLIETDADSDAVNSVSPAVFTDTPRRVTSMTAPKLATNGAFNPKETD